jgi:hypothetical protein
MAGLSRWSVINVEGTDIVPCDSCKCEVLISVNLMLRECLAIRVDFRNVYIPYSEGICVCIASDSPVWLC